MMNGSKGENKVRIIVSHINTDFDALASMIAAKKLYPNHTVVVSNQQTAAVRHFLNIYRDMLSFSQPRDIDWSAVRELVLVDVASINRIGNFVHELSMEQLQITLYDHHPERKQDIHINKKQVEQVGATVTLLIEKIKKRSIPISEFEATLFGLGIYTDTGNFTYNHTTKRDFAAAKFLMDQGMNIDLIVEFSEQTLSSEQQQLLDQLFSDATIKNIDGLEVLLTNYEQKQFTGGLAILTEKLLDLQGVDAAITVVKMNRHVYIVGRATSERIDLTPFLKQWKGGGHNHAGSATIKDSALERVWKEVVHSVHQMIKPPIVAKDIMASPVKTLSDDTTIKKAGELMYRYGHSGYPIVKDNRLIGLITRRDLDKANHHGLGHAPVKAYMTTKVRTITPHTPLEEIQNIIVEHNIGRLPVIEGDKVVGIVTRTNIISILHKDLHSESELAPILKENMTKEMKDQLPSNVFTILQDISILAQRENFAVYLIGGIVRDLLLHRPNDDIDIVVEGDGIAFANKLEKEYGGQVDTYEQFGTALWKHSSGMEIDIASSRLEYYAHPASLPDVERSTLQEDLHRRDFTINAIGIKLNEAEFGQIVDPFSGQQDLQKKTIRILHNLSFVEDPTRILRAVRFETRFHFRMDEQTENLALHSMEKMQDVSTNRIVEEMKRLFKEQEPLAVIERLFSLQFWDQYGVHLNKKELVLEYAKRLQTLFTQNDHFIKQNRSSLWFAYFLLPFYMANQEARARPFALTKDEKKLYEDIVQLKKESWHNYSSIGELHKSLKDSLTLAVLFTIANREENERIQNKVITYIQRRQHIPTYITGTDLTNLGLTPGPLFKTILLELQCAILDDQVASKEDAVDWVRDFVHTQITDDK